MKEALTTAQAGRILGISSLTVRKLIRDKQLRAWTVPSTSEYRTLLSTVVSFAEKGNFPRALLLRFLEDNGANPNELEQLGITEPIGVGQIRFYPKDYGVLTTGDVAKLSYVNEGTVRKCFDNGELNGYGVLTRKRVSADNYLRFAIGNDIPYEGKQLEAKTSLLVEYPGSWGDGDRLINDGSLWYRQVEAMQEISVRDGMDGLYVLRCGGYIDLILVGMTGREGYGVVAHPDHINQIKNFLDMGEKLAKKISQLDISGIIIETLEQAQQALNENYKVTKAVQLRMKVLNSV